jgi:2-dehydro-3-deoxyphosphogluconate aldolase / (4S)-4-hydroxy-2-oxoglutarate aldolase
VALSSKQKKIDIILGKAPVVPVMVIEDVRQAVPLAKALVKGGLPVLEITLRTEDAFDAIKAILDEVDGAVVGVGTVMTSKQLNKADKLGCAFAVSPGATGKLLGAAEDVKIPFLPGGVTASEVMALLEWGYTFQKFFPAESAGGVSTLSSLASPIPQVKFCPTGGITVESAPRYLALPNVVTVGGSWMVPKKLVQEGSWEAIRVLASEAAKLKA